MKSRQQKKQQTKNQAKQQSVILEIFSILVALVALLLLMILISYNPEDPSPFYAPGNLGEDLGGDTDTGLGDNTPQATNILGISGAWLSSYIYYFLGYGAFLIPIFMLWSSFNILGIRQTSSANYANSTYIRSLRRLGGLLFLLAVCGLLSLMDIRSLPATGGGRIGISLASNSINIFGSTGSIIVMLFVATISFSLFVWLSWLQLFDFIGGLLLSVFSKIAALPKALLSSLSSFENPAKNEDLANQSAANQALLDESPDHKLNASDAPRDAKPKNIFQRAFSPIRRDQRLEPNLVFMPGQSDIATQLEQDEAQLGTSAQDSQQAQTEEQIHSAGKNSAKDTDREVGKPPLVQPRVYNNKPPEHRAQSEVQITQAASSSSSTNGNRNDTNNSQETTIQQNVTGTAQSKAAAHSASQPASQPATNQAAPAQYNLPQKDLLEASGASSSGVSDQQLQEMGEILINTLKDFNIEAKILGYSPGPVVTRFEIEPAAGIKASRISNLASDLSRSLAVGNLRVVEFISGKSCIGIEVPNPQRQVVNFRTLLESKEFASSTSTLPLALGQDISGKPMIVDLAAMPHLLVAGTTGSGKSIGINAMILSLLYIHTPQTLRLIMIDPKMLEMVAYQDIPHLMTPVITDMNLAGKSINWCVGEMERRYKLMADYGSRNIASYNESVLESISRNKDKNNKSPSVSSNNQQTSPDDAEPSSDSQEHDILPYIVLVIDEYADMIMINRKLEDSIVRLAQKARAAGIHIILATQRPSVDVITGLIKANIPARISFKVSSKVDSRTILDQSGSEQLLGKGDMLYLGSDDLIRVHGAFVTDNDIKNTTDYCRTQSMPSYQDDVFEAPADPAKAIAASLSSSSSSSQADEDKDDLYNEAVDFVKQAQRVSISSVQRKFKIGYNRAARIIESMEEEGIVSEMDGAGKRQVLQKD